MNKQDVDTLARTIYGEARGEFQKTDGGLKSLQAVGWVAKNRLKNKAFGKTIQEICLKPWQFSCWNHNDPNRKIIEKISREDWLFQICEEAALNVLAGTVPDCTYGANHYHSRFTSPPYWANKSKITTQIADHVFYKLGE